MIGRASSPSVALRKRDHPVRQAPTIVAPVGPKYDEGGNIPILRSRQRRIDRSGGIFLGVIDRATAFISTRGCGTETKKDQGGKTGTDKHGDLLWGRHCGT